MATTQQRRPAIKRAAKPTGTAATRAASARRTIFPVVGVGASAGGLEAFRKLLIALPADSGMAFVLIQHLDPTHESMMVGLLAGHTAMAVVQAADGMVIEA